MSRRLRSIPLPPRLSAALQALFVTFLWSTSWVLIKFGLQDIPALTFAGLRYMLAFACLAPFALTAASRAGLRRLSRRDWLGLAGLGLLLFALTQGAQFLALAYLPALTTSLLWNFSTVAVALLGALLLSERPTRWQWAGVALNLGGVLVYFYPPVLPIGQWIGIGIAGLGVLANAGAAVLGRQVNRAAAIAPVLVTSVSMGLGAGLLLGAGVAWQGWPRLELIHWAVVIWLAVVNTAFAFTLWNRTLRVLSAVESSIINGTMLIQIGVLAWVFLGERLTLWQGLGMALAALGALAVQLGGGRLRGSR